jgi:hypothetical protein
VGVGVGVSVGSNVGVGVRLGAIVGIIVGDGLIVGVGTAGVPQPDKTNSKKTSLNTSMFFMLSPHYLNKASSPANPEYSFSNYTR